MNDICVDSVRDDILVWLYKTMVRIRVFEERTAELVELGEIRCPTHLYVGQEAIAAGVCGALRQDDYVVGNHRSHGHYLAKGGDLKSLMAELYCKTTGCSKGRGGSMHLIDKGAGVLGTVPMVASTIPIAVGAALAFSLRGTDQVSVAFFGDGATEEGLFHESLNFASLRRLPVLFVCENNLYASHLGLKARRRNDTIQEFAFPYRMATERIDGNDAVAVYVAALNAVIRARRGEGPTLLECRTYRWRGHVGPKWDLDVGIRDRAELEFWISKCPIGNLERLFDVTGKLSSEERVSIWQAIHDEVSESVEFARLSPDPTEGELEEHVFLGEGS